MRLNKACLILYNNLLCLQNLTKKPVELGKVLAMSEKNTRKKSLSYAYMSDHSIPANILITVAILLLFTAVSVVIYRLLPESDGSHGVIYLVYSMALILIAMHTNGYVYSIVSSLVSVVFINYAFTYPYHKLNFTLSGYPLIFSCMLVINLLSCTLTAQLRRQQKEILRREALLRAAELEKMRANLLRAVSHDLRTPLTGIIGNSSLYLEQSDGMSESEKKELIASIQSDSVWLLNLVENLLTVTRIQGDNLLINTRPEPVEEVVSEALQRIKKRFPDSRIHASVPEEMLFIPMDPVLIEQVIINLIENAIVHSETNAPIEFTVSVADDKVSFCIKDYGKGIDPEKLPTLFDGGDVSGMNAYDSRRGMGIGLSICKTIISAHHGEIYCENHKSGAAFCFVLPKGEINIES